MTATIIRLRDRTPPGVRLVLPGIDFALDDSTLVRIPMVSSTYDAALTRLLQHEGPRNVNARSDAERPSLIVTGVAVRQFCAMRQV